MELLSRTAQGEKKKKVDLETQKESVAQSESGMMSWGGEEGGETEVEMQNEAREM